MNDSLELITTSEELLSKDYDLDFTDEELDEMNATVEALISKYGWDKVYNTWCDYLHTKCTNDWSVVNFAKHFWDYAHDRYIPDPIHFIAYLYYRVDTLKNDDAMQIFDSLAISIQERAGLINMIKDPLYTAERDPKIQAEIAAIKSQES